MIDEAYQRAYDILTEKHDEWERLAQGLLEYETLTGEEIDRVIKGDPPEADDDQGGTPQKDDTPSLTAIPKTKPKSTPPDGGLEPEPKA